MSYVFMNCRKMLILSHRCLTSYFYPFSRCCHSKQNVRIKGALQITRVQQYIDAMTNLSLDLYILLLLLLSPFIRVCRKVSDTCREERVCVKHTEKCTIISRKYEKHENIFVYQQRSLVFLFVVVLFCTARFSVVYKLSS